jgi:hypothetical protein
MTVALGQGHLSLQVLVTQGQVRLVLDSTFCPNWDILRQQQYHLQA